MPEELTTPSGITIQFKYSFDEYIDAFRLHYSQLKRLKRNIVFSVVLLLLGVALCLFLGYSFFNSVPIYASVILVAFLLSEFFLAPSKIFHSDPRLQEEHVLIFSDEKILFRNAKMTIALKWKQYSHFVENDEFYLLYYQEETFLIIPKRCFKTESMESFKKLLNSKLVPPGSF